MQLYQFCFSHQKTLIFVLRTVSLAHLGKKTSFFSLDVPNWLCSAQKSRFFYSRIKTAIIAHKLNSQFSQCTAKPAGLQSKTDRKTKKNIALRASSFFTQRKPFVPKFLERKNHSSAKRRFSHWGKWFLYRTKPLRHHGKPVYRKEKTSLLDQQLIKNTMLRSKFYISWVILGKNVF